MLVLRSTADVDVYGQWSQLVPIELLLTKQQHTLRERLLGPHPFGHQTFCHDNVSMFFAFPDKNLHSVLPNFYANAKPCCVRFEDGTNSFDSVQSTVVSKSVTGVVPFTYSHKLVLHHRIPYSSATTPSLELVESRCHLNTIEKGARKRW